MQQPEQVQSGKALEGLQGWAQRVGGAVIWSAKVHDRSAGSEIYDKSFLGALRTILIPQESVDGQAGAK